MTDTPVRDNYIEEEENDINKAYSAETLSKPAVRKQSSDISINSNLVNKEHIYVTGPALSQSVTSTDVRFGDDDKVSINSMLNDKSETTGSRDHIAYENESDKSDIKGENFDTRSDNSDKSEKSDSSDKPYFPGDYYNIPKPSRRFRRRYNQIIRKYNCTFQGCTKSYGSLNHLNTHIVTKNHGQRKSKLDFHSEDYEVDYASVNYWNGFPQNRNPFYYYPNNQQFHPYMMLNLPKFIPGYSFPGNLPPSMAPNTANQLPSQLNTIPPHAALPLVPLEVHGQSSTSNVPGNLPNQAHRLVPGIPGVPSSSSRNHNDFPYGYHPGHPTLTPMVSAYPIFPYPVLHSTLTTGQSPHLSHSPLHSNQQSPLLDATSNPTPHTQALSHASSSPSSSTITLPPLNLPPK